MDLTCKAYLPAGKDAIAACVVDLSQIGMLRKGILALGGSAPCHLQARLHRPSAAGGASWPRCCWRSPRSACRSMMSAATRCCCATLVIFSGELRASAGAWAAAVAIVAVVVAGQ